MTTNGQSKLEATIDRLNEAVDECREATRDAHAATKDLRGVVAEARKLLDQEPHDIIEAKIGAAVAEGLAEYSTTIRAAQDKAVAQVMATFDELSELLMAGQKRHGKVRVDTAIRKAWQELDS